MTRSLYLLLLFLVAPGAMGQELPSIAAKTRGLERTEGFIPFYWDADKGDLWLEISRVGDPFLLVHSLSAGLGSNAIGLDRGLIGAEYIVRFERVGRQLLLIAENQGYRAASRSESERRAVKEAFAESVLWGFNVEAAGQGRVLVRANDFLLRDALGIVQRLKGAGQGAYQVDAQRSAPYRNAIKAFPLNTELEATLTFTADSAGRLVASVSPDGKSFTVRQRISLVALPPPGYEPRVFDPRSGYGATKYVDFSVPVGELKERRFINRHRLLKKNPGAARSEAIEPIVYYLDPGTPEPIRSALLEGASWWNRAFESAGFLNAFRVALLPEGADPMDLRYNMIQWVHRSTRGWSYGQSVVDPRTGEILKGHVLLGSLRVRQDYLLAEGLLSPYGGTHAGGYANPESDPMLALSLARLRQLAAHEVGHTLGLVHNFAASSTGRSSVMDYPAPHATLRTDGTISLEEAYAVGMGAWDDVAIQYGYSVFPDDADESAELDGILEAARARGLRFITDDDARDVAGAHPFAHLWDNGADAVSGLTEVMAVRRTALDRFGVASIPEGRPMALLGEVLTPTYLMHRYQIEAAAKLVGGVDYAYTVRGRDERPTSPVQPAEQTDALRVLMETLRPGALRLPEAALALIPPRPAGFPATEELLPGRQRRSFDGLAPAEAVAELVVGLLLHPERAARLQAQRVFRPELPDLDTVFDAVEGVSLGAAGTDPVDAELQSLVVEAYVTNLIHLAGPAGATGAVRAAALARLKGLRATFAGAEAIPLVRRDFLTDEIERFLNRPFDGALPTQPVRTPPGMPIGSDGPAFAGHPTPQPGSVHGELLLSAASRVLLDQVDVLPEACGETW